MRLTAAHLLGFRNIVEARLECSPTVNIFLGDNGQGKTNLLEALDYLSLGRSFRGSKDGELVGFAASAAHLRIEARDEHEATLVLEAGIDRQGRRKLRVDGVDLKRKSDLVGRLPTVVYDPRTVDLIRGGPRWRRRYLDRGLSLLSRDYLRQLQRYQRALRQKIHVLREGRRRQTSLAAVAPDLQAWNRELAGSGSALLRARRDLVRELEPLASSLHARLTGRQDQLQLFYRQGIDLDDSGSAAGDFEGDFCARLDYIMGDEYQRGRCLAGPHLDDLDVSLCGVVLRTFGSQGETRTVAIALQLAQGEMIWRRTGVRPVLLLDDIFSELDTDRAHRLQELTAADHQVFIATARREDIAAWHPSRHRVWHVRAGEVRQET